MAAHITTINKDPAAPLVQPGSLSSTAYVTFLAGDVDDVKGVVGLARGLRKVGSGHPLVVAILPDVSKELRKKLVSQGCIVREIEPVHPPANQTQFAINYSKLRIWEFVEYGKMIYLNVDAQVFENIDHLFDLQDGYFHAVMDCFCQKEWSHTPQSKIGYCQYCPDKVQWPAELGPNPAFYFNAGMFVFEPDLSTYHDLMKILKEAPPTPFADQDLLNMFFKDKYIPIPPIYNLVLPLMWHHPENIDLQKVKVVRFCAAGSKPWKFTGEEENMDREDIKMLVNRWCNIYNEASEEAVLHYNATADPPQPFLASLFKAAASFWGLLGGRMKEESMDGEDIKMLMKPF